jgi:hypothetical protein
MGMAPTLFLMGLLTILALVCGWRSSIPWDPAKGPRMIPYRILMISSAGILMFLAAHALNLAGIQTGH